MQVHKGDQEMQQETEDADIRHKIYRMDSGGPYTSSSSGRGAADF